MQVWLPPGFGLGAGAGAGGAGGPGGAGGVGAGAGPPPVQGQDGLPHFGQGRLPGHISGGEAAGLQSTTGGGATGAAEAAERSTRSAAHAIAGWFLSMGRARGMEHDPRTNPMAEAAHGQMPYGIQYLYG